MTHEPYAAGGTIFVTASAMTECSRIILMRTSRGSVLDLHLGCVQFHGFPQSQDEFFYSISNRLLNVGKISYF
jgi:hypothetical protein